MNSVKLLHIKCCLFQFFNSPVALKNTKKIWPPPRKSWNDAPDPINSFQLVDLTLTNIIIVLFKPMITYARWAGFEERTSRWVWTADVVTTRNGWHKNTSDKKCSVSNSSEVVFDIHKSPLEMDLQKGSRLLEQISFQLLLEKWWIFWWLPNSKAKSIRVEFKERLMELDDLDGMLEYVWKTHGGLHQRVSRGRK